MNPEVTTELVWHFAGYLHLTEDYTASRLKYQDVAIQGRSSEYEAHYEQRDLPSIDAPELSSYKVRVTYSPKYDRLEQNELTKLQGNDMEAAVPAARATELLEVNPKVALSTGDLGQGLIKPVAPAQPDEEQDHEPIYEMGYSDELGSQHANLVQQNVATDKDYFSDGGAPYEALTHVPTGDAIPDMLDAAREFIPDLNVQPGMGMTFWTDEITSHDQAMASGEIEGAVIAAGRYVNGELQKQVPEASELPDSIAPTPPERAEGDKDPGQIAELGGNKAQNVALIADVNEAPATLIVVGDYYETNKIVQANVFQDKDQILEAGSPSSVEVADGGNRSDNIASFTAKEIATQVAAQQYTGDLNVHIDFVDGDLFDVKALTQRNFIDDGDVSVQTRFDSYSKVLMGGNEQTNAAVFEDWGKHYDIIIVLGDYHSANIISQTNVLLDDDLIGAGTGSNPAAAAISEGVSDSNASVYSGQNSLLNEAAITQYGATTFDGITGNINDLIESLSNRENLDASAWSSFHGAASGQLNVLFVTGSYYDLNVISQINVIADADLAVQVGAGSGLQWLSTGGNSAINAAEIINSGGIYNQYLGGSLYDDSVLVQANLVSEASQVAQTNPAALVPELVAFIDHTQEAMPSDAETWTSNTYTNQDTFGHVLT